MQDTLMENEELPLFLSISRININPMKKLQATSHKMPIINILMKELELELDWDILVVQKKT